MPKFSYGSLVKLETCDKRLIQLMMDVVQGFDCTILSGYRGQQEQDDLHQKGLSRKKYPYSKHNHRQSLAVDIAPYPINWRDKDRFYHFAGFVMGVAYKKGIEIRWGGDWDGDTDLHDQTFFDLCHFELKEVP